MANCRDHIQLKSEGDWDERKDAKPQRRGEKKRKISSSFFASWRLRVFALCFPLVLWGGGCHAWWWNLFGFDAYARIAVNDEEGVVWVVARDDFNWKGSNPNRGGGNIARCNLPDALVGELELSAAVDVNREGELSWSSNFLHFKNKGLVKPVF
jgi:hypothetical protein